MRNSFAVRIRGGWTMKILLAIVFLLLFGIIVLLVCLAAVAFRIAGYYQLSMEDVR